jgi:large subunit ribosomal protein L19
MTHPVIQDIEKSQMKKRVPAFKVGDTVEVRTRIQEGDRERIQPFIGTVIARKGAGPRETFIVRRIVQGEGVERVFPLHNPNIVEVRVRHRGEVRRAKLYYLRDRVGKATRVKGRIVHERERREMAAEAAAEAKAEAAEAEAPEEPEAQNEEQ